MKKLLLGFAVSTMALGFTACSDDDDDNGQSGIKPNPDAGLFIVNNGNYGAPNASLSFYDPKTGTVSNNVFSATNGIPLGEVAQSISVYGDDAFVCVNGSNVVYEIDADDYEIEHQILGVSSPRYALEYERGNVEKIYISQMNSNEIAVVNGDTYRVEKSIVIDELSKNIGCEQLILAPDGYIYSNCWSYGKTIVKIDPATDRAVASLEVGIQPQSIAVDAQSGMLWTLCDGGGWDQNPVGYEAPSLVAIDLKTFTVSRRIELPFGSVSNLNYYNGYLYWLQNGVQRMSVSATEVPAEPYIATTSLGLYALTVNPATGEIYVGDAIDYQQAGVVVRYGADGKKISDFQVGIIPAGFAWKN